MEYFLTDDQKELKRISRRIAEETILPVRERLDREGGYPYEIMKVIDEAGLPAVYIPEAYGGMGLDKITDLVVTEAMDEGGGSWAVSFGGHVGIGTLPIVIFGNEEQKRRYLPRHASGEWLAAYALTEPNSGSDALSVRTTAKLTAGGRQ